MSKISHGEPYAGKLHVRFDEGWPPKTGASRFEGSPKGRADVPYGGVSLYSTPSGVSCAPKRLFTGNPGQRAGGGTAFDAEMRNLSDRAIEVA